MMKWDVKHDLAKQVIDGYLERAKAEMQEQEVVAGLSDEDKAVVSEELALMIESIRKRYKLQERLPEQPKVETVAEVQTEEKAEAPAEEPQTEDTPKQKRTRKKAESTGEKKERKPRTKKAKEEVA